MQKLLRYSKEDLKDLSIAEADGKVVKLDKWEIGDIRMLAHYQQHLSANGLLPDNITTFCFNSITLKDWKSFVDHPDFIALISSTGDITAQPLLNTGLDSNFKAT